MANRNSADGKASAAMKSIALYSEAWLMARMLSF
jgi:hypothetical protein